MQLIRDQMIQIYIYKIYACMNIFYIKVLYGRSGMRSLANIQYRYHLYKYGTTGSTCCCGVVVAIIVFVISSTPSFQVHIIGYIISSLNPPILLLVKRSVAQEHVFLRIDYTFKYSHHSL